MRFKEYILSGFLAVAIGISGISFYNNYKLKNDASFWRTEALQNSVLYETEKGVSSKRALEVDRLTTDNKNLNSAIKNSDEEIKSLTSFNAFLSDSIGWLNSNWPEVVELPEGFSIDSSRAFSKITPSFTISGYFEIIDPYRIYIEAIKAQIDITVMMTQNKDKVWTAYVGSANPEFSVEALDTEVSPYAPTFWENLSFSLGGYTGPSLFGVQAGLYYGKHSMSVSFNNYGGAIGYARLFSVN